MYDELVQRLREVADEVNNDYSVDPYNAEQRCLVIEQAANAIEKLADRNVGKWIPVTEQMPKTRESILGKKSSKVIVAFRFDDGTQGTDTAHTLNGKWVFEDHITVVKRTITHWMALPKPPKEET